MWLLMIIIVVLCIKWLFDFNRSELNEIKSIKHIGDPKYTKVDTNKLLKTLQTNGDLSKLDVGDLFVADPQPVITDVYILVERLVETVDHIATDGDYTREQCRDYITDVVLTIYPDPFLGLDKSGKYDRREFVKSMIEYVILSKKHEHRTSNPEYHTDNTVQSKLEIKPTKPEGISLVKDDKPNEDAHPVTFDELERRLTQYIPGEYSTQSEDK